MNAANVIATRRRRRVLLRARPTLAAVAIGALLTSCTSHPSQPSTVQKSDATSGSRSSTPSDGGPSASAASSRRPLVSGDQAGAITAGLVPLPVLAQTDSSASFSLTSATRIVADGGADADAIANDLAADLRPATGFPLTVTAASASSATKNAVVVSLRDADSRAGNEGYDLTISPDAVLLTAPKAAGLFHGVQTIRQLLPAAIDATSVQPGPWHLVGGQIVDYPTYAYRGAMLDVTRHFFPVSAVERYIDELALYKVNMLHLHLSDDQGWRIAVNTWPNLTTHGGSTEVGGGPGGFYTQDDYRTIVQYAQQHFVTVVPEIDTPGHVNAALASYPQLNCDGKARPLYTGEQVGFSSLCVASPTTYTFLDDVVGELAALTPGPYIHLGGDEAQSTPATDYVTFVEKAQAIVAAHGKQLMGWAEIAKAKLAPTAVAEYWNFSDHGATETAAVAQGVKLVLAPADHAYLDQKYTAETTLGLNWAGDTEVDDAYNWDPTDGGRAPASDVLGVEAPLWSETLHTMSDIEYMAWPRMAGIAEIGWTPKAERSWNGYKTRLAQQGPRWKAMGINFYASPLVPWAS